MFSAQAIPPPLRTRPSRSQTRALQPCTYHFHPQSRTPPPSAYHFRPRSRTPPSRTYRFCVRVGAYCIRPTNVFDRKRMPPPRAYHFRTRSRTPQSRAYHFRTRVGAYCIRPTTVFGRKRMPCICVIHFRMYAGFVRFRSCDFARIRPVPGRLWGVFNTPLHGDENVTRRMSLSVPGYMKRSCGFCYSSIYRSSPCQFSGLMMMYSEIR